MASFACVPCIRIGAPPRSVVMGWVVHNENGEVVGIHASRGAAARHWLRLLWRLDKGLLGVFFLVELGKAVRVRVDAFAVAAQIVLDMTLPRLVGVFSWAAVGLMTVSQPTWGGVLVIGALWSYTARGNVHRARQPYHRPDPVWDGLLSFFIPLVAGVFSLLSLSGAVASVLYLLAVLCVLSPRIPEDDERRRRNCEASTTGALASEASR